jgi:hypothetical protein
MKKFLPVAIVLAAVLCAGLVHLWREAPYRVRGEEIAPPDALVFVQLPDLQRTARRWPETALAQLWAEPEVQALLKAPLEQMPALRRVREHAVRLARVAPREAFVALVAADGAEVKFVAGLHFAGSKSEVATLVAEPWAAWRAQWPAGRSEVLHRPQWEIETYAVEERLLAGSFHAGWYFLSDDLAALEATLGRCQGGASTGIGSTAALRRAAAPLPPEPDLFIFAQPGRLLDRLGALLAGATPAVEKTPADFQPIAWGVKLEGPGFRDTIFIPGVGSPKVSLRRSTQALTAPDSLLYGAFLLPPRAELPPAVAPFFALLATQPWLVEAGERVSWAEFAAGFGPEGGIVLDWPPAADAPSLSFLFQVRDTGRAAHFVESLTGPSARDAPWQRLESGRTAHFQMPAGRPGGSTPALSLTPDFLVLGAQSHAVRSVATRLNAGSADITQSPPFHEIAARVKTPTAAFAYLDLRAFIERSYETLRPFLGMSLALSPETSPYFDPARLPSRETLARHLGPSVYSQTTRHDGIFIESVGSLSLSQTLASLTVGAWSSVGPALSRLGKNETRPAMPTKLELPAAVPISAPRRANAAETSRKSGNADETSQIQPSQR